MSREHFFFTQILRLSLLEYLTTKLIDEKERLVNQRVDEQIRPDLGWLALR